MPRGCRRLPGSPPLPRNSSCGSPTLFYLAREPGDVRGDETADVARPVEIVHFLHRLDEIADDSRLDRALVVEDFELAIIVVGRADVGGTQARSLDQDLDRLAAMGI